MRFNTHRLLAAAVISVGAIGLTVAGCDMSPDVLEDNNGSALTTTPGAQLKESMFLGKWDLDGERTNTANGNSGVTDIPTDVVKDILGKGWKFHAGGGLSIDQTIGTKEGSWKLQGDTVTIDEGGGPHTYTARFQDGFLYLKKADGKYIVLERAKFFGF